MADKLETIQILFVKRNARKRGNTSSDDLNDMIDEIAHDLAAFNTQWNNRLVTLTSVLPDGTVDSSLNAFTNGLSGRHMYADATATATYNSTYFNSSSYRPNSILEQFNIIYGDIQTVRNDLSADISAISQTAEEILIADTGGYYTAANVEAALAEVKVAVNNISLGALDLSAVAQHYVPLTDDTYDLGTSTKRIRDLYLGPASLYIKALASQAETPSDRTYKLKVNSSTGDLELVETVTSTVLAQFSTTGSTIDGTETSPAGSTSQIQYNSGGSFAASSNLTFSGNVLYIGGSITSPSHNFRFGTSAGGSITSAYDNIIFGNTAGQSLTTGHSNVCIGNSAGQSLTTDNNNIFIGNAAGIYLSNGDDNIAIGNAANASMIQGDDNVILGNATFTDCLDGSRNVCLGELAGSNIVSGDANVFIGDLAGVGGSGSPNPVAYENICIGTQAGADIGTNGATSDYNVYIGYHAAWDDEGSNNICIGANTAMATISTNYGLNIGNAITGDLSTGDIAIANDLDVFGDFSLSGVITSDLNIDGNATVSGQLEINTTVAGFLPPRLTEAEKMAIASPVDGLMVYNTTSGTVDVYKDSLWRSLSWQ